MVKVESREKAADKFNSRYGEIETDETGTIIRVGGVEPSDDILRQIGSVYGVAFRIVVDRPEAPKQAPRPVGRPPAPKLPVAAPAPVAVEAPPVVMAAPVAVEPPAPVLPVASKPPMPKAGKKAKK